MGWAMLVQVNRPLSMARTEIHSRRRRPKDAFLGILNMPELDAPSSVAAATINLTPESEAADNTTTMASTT